MLTHWTAEHNHHIEKCAKGFMVALDVLQHGLGEPFAFQPLRQRKKGR